MSTTISNSFSGTYSDGVFTVSSATDHNSETINSTGILSYTHAAEITSGYYHANTDFTYVGVAMSGGTSVGFVIEQNGYYVLLSDSLTAAAKNTTFTVDASTGSADPQPYNWNLATAQPTAYCFLAGTMIATPAGEVPVETLAAGDLVRLADGGTVPVRWMGRHTVSRRFGDPLRIWPVRIRAGALAEGVPRRDLLLSPGHAVRIGGVIAHAAALVNGVSVVRETRVPEAFVYWHVELDTHALILAESAPAETFLDGTEELAFDNLATRPAAPVGAEELPLPRIKSQRQLPVAVREHLAVRSTALMGTATQAA